MGDGSEGQQGFRSPDSSDSPGNELQEPLKRSGFSRWRFVVVVGVVVVVAVGGGFMGWNFLGKGEVMSERVKEEEKQLSQEEAYAFVLEHVDNVVASAKKFFEREEEHGYLKIEFVEVIRESVKVGGRDTPMVKASGLIYYNYYINGNRDYEVVGDSMIGPYYEGTLIENIADPNVPGKVYGDGATVSERFHEIKAAWAAEIRRPAEEARAARVAEEIAFIEEHKDRVLEFARERYKDDERVPEIKSVEIEPDTYPNVQYPEGVIIFDFFINGDERFKVYLCGMVGPGYPGVLRKREPDGHPLRAVAEGFDGSSLKPGDIFDYMVDEEWRRGRWND